MPRITAQIEIGAEINVGEGDAATIGVQSGEVVPIPPSAAVNPAAIFGNLKPLLPLVLPVVYQAIDGLSASLKSYLEGLVKS